MTKSFDTKRHTWSFGPSAWPRRSAKVLPYGVYLAAVIMLCLAGLGLTAYLSDSHYRLYSDISYESFCALTRVINCDSVSQSQYAVLGKLPVAVWGFLGYALFLALVLFSAGSQSHQGRVWALNLTTACILSAVSMVFAFISTFKIHSYCILCIATYAINLTLTYLAWLIRRRFSATGSLFAAMGQDLRFLWARRRLSLPVFAGLVLSAALTYASFPAYWRVAMSISDTAVIRGLTPEGYPWIGAMNPTLEITEFSDYQCFQCRKVHFYLRQLIARHPNKLRLVHRHYPMDHEVNPTVKEPFHVGAGKMALLAIHAAATGKFWEMNDFLFEVGGLNTSINLVEAAQKTGMDPVGLSAALEHQPYRRHLLRDLHQGIKLGINGTPSFLIEGRVYTGSIPAEILVALREPE